MPNKIIPCLECRNHIEEVETSKAISSLCQHTITVGASNTVVDKKEEEEEASFETTQD